MDVQVKKEKIGDEDDTDLPTQKTESSATKSQSQLISPVFRNKAPPTQKTQSPAKDSDSDNDGMIDVMNSTRGSQGSKRMAEETPEKTKPGLVKKKKKTTAALVMGERSLRSQTIKK